MDLLRDARFSVASRGPGAAYAGWLLRAFGAKVEHQSALDPEGLGAFLAEGASFLRDVPVLFGTSDPLITDAPVTPANRRLLESAAEARQVIWITPWGLGNSWSERPASDLALYAASGWLSTVGDPDRQPLAPPGSQDQLVAGLFATIAALEHHARGESAAVGLVDVPILEALVATLIYDPVAFQYFGTLRGRAGNRFSKSQPLLATLACKDGFMGLHSPLHPQWKALTELLGHPEMKTDPRFAGVLERAANIAALDEEYLLPWLATRTRWEAYHEFQRNRIPASGHPDMAELLASPQLNARKSFVEVSTPSGRRYRVPGPPARERAVSGPGPRESGDGPWRPGALRVLDFSMGWAGPLVTLNLASMGADVIKVESHTHFDWWRGSRPPGDEAMGLHERSHVFNTANRGKRGIALDLATAQGRQLAIDLAATADVVIENYAAGVIEKLGLSYDVLRQRNPSLIMIRQPGFGSDGPESGYVVFGNTIEGMSGLSSLTGYQGGPPTMLHNAFGDPVSGLGGTVATLAALAGRSADGKGRLLECAQLEGFLPMVSEGLVEYQRTQIIPPRHANQQAGHEPSGAFHAGDDRWIAIDVRTDPEWAALADQIGEAWALEPDLASATGREDRRTDVHSSLSHWVAATGEDAVLEACLRAGVPAAAAINEGETLALEPLLVSGFWQGMEREPVGFHLHPSIAYSAGGVRPIPQTPAPFLGEHTEEILAALGLDAAARAELSAAGVTGREPVPA